MEDLTQLALKLFEIEKKHLLEEGEILLRGRDCHKTRRAKGKNATAIIAINTAREQDMSDESELESYWWGKLAAENRYKCLFLTISEPGSKSLSMSLPFSVENNQVDLGRQTEFESTIVSHVTKLALVSQYELAVTGIWQIKPAETRS